MQAELAGLKAEVHTLHDQLREAENRARRAAGTTPFPRLPDATASERLAHAEGAAAEAQQALTAANSSAAEAARSAFCTLQGNVPLLPCRGSFVSHTSSSHFEDGVPSSSHVHASWTPHGACNTSLLLDRCEAFKVLAQVFAPSLHEHCWTRHKQASAQP